MKPNKNLVICLFLAILLGMPLLGGEISQTSDLSLGTPVAANGEILELNSTVATSAVTVDGEFTSAEWSEAEEHQILYNKEVEVQPGYTYPKYQHNNNTLSLSIKNDADNIYFGVHITGAILLTGDLARLALVFDRDNAGSLTEGDLSYNVTQNNKTHGIFEYMNRTGDLEWRRQFNWSTDRIVEFGIQAKQSSGQSQTVQMEIVVPFEMIGIAPGDSINMRIDYEEESKVMEYQNISHDFLPLNTVDTENTHHYWIEQTAITAEKDSTDENLVHISWTEIPGAVNYMVFQLPREPIWDLRDGSYVQYRIANREPGDDFSLTVNRTHIYEYNEFFYVLAFNEYGVPSETGIIFEWTDYMETDPIGTDTIFMIDGFAAFPVFLVGGLALLFYLSKKQRH